MIPESAKNYFIILATQTLLKRVLVFEKSLCKKHDPREI